MASSLEARVAALERLAWDVPVVHLGTADSAWSDGSDRVRATAAACKLAGSALVTVPSDYYSTPLEARAQLLQCAKDRLCKCLVFERQAGTGSPALGQHRYVCVCIQYVRRIDLKALEGVVGGPVKLAADGDAVTGFLHNAVSPIGMSTPMPLIVDARIAALPSPCCVWLGGGHELVKLRVFVSELRRYTEAVMNCPCIVASISAVRSSDDGDEDE